jgi:ribosomal protein S18 acetylase RimI-like enzyme
MRNWFYKYSSEGQTVRGAVVTPSIDGLLFSHVRDQLVIPYLRGAGVSGVTELTYERAKHAPGIVPVKAQQIAPHIVVNGKTYSTATGGAAETLVLRAIQKADLPQATALWNTVVAAGDSFPGDELLSEQQAWDMFMEQTQTVCAVIGEEVAGVYILHPNNIGRCSHIANASYAVRADRRGQGIGRALVCDCLQRAKTHGFRGLQFNAVVASNTAAIALYLGLGFRILGTVPGGYRHKDGSYRDTLIFLKTWDNGK